MSNIKPIETVYKSYRFRSRLEARWAVFFDALGIQWEYEKEGFDLDGIRYLPDFWLPQQKCFIEIKGQDPSQEEHLKCLAVAKGGKKIYMFAGNIPHFGEREVYTLFLPYLGYAYDQGIGFDGYGDDKPQWGWNKCAVWQECIFCGAVDITQHMNIREFPCGCVARYLDFSKVFGVLTERYGNKVNDFIDNFFAFKMHPIMSYYDTPRLIAAYAAARQARFEHGEKGV